MNAVLPFDKVATIRKQGGEEVAVDVPVAIWPAGTQQTAKGDAYDFTGEAHPAFAEDLVRKTNRELIVASRRYKVVDAVAEDYFTHVSLRLREMR